MTNRAFYWAVPLVVASTLTVVSASAEAQDAAKGEVNPADVPSPVRVIGARKTYTPIVHYQKKAEAAAAGFIALRGEEVSTFPVDRYGTSYRAGFAFAPQARLAAFYDTRKTSKFIAFRADYEHDLPTGFVTSITPPAGSELPDQAPVTTQLRKLGFRVSLGRAVHLSAGYTTNQFGLGLLANDGASNNWVPGSARFADNRGGDRVLRGALATGPWTSLGITAAFAGDAVVDDDVLLPGDEAKQGIFTVSIGHGKKTGAGIFIVRRNLTTPTGGETNVTAIDFTARHESIGQYLTFSIEGEAALITGQTTVGATPEIPEQDILQFGAIVRAAMRARYGGTVLDVLYASGDNNPDDNKQTGFRADPNMEMGLLLYRYVIAAQTGRATATAGDPNLVGIPSRGLERIPTRGAPTNTLAIFPRFYVRPVSGLEVYGGPLLALAMAPLYDPLNTRIAGGTVKNALNGRAGTTLGLELDIGVRQRILLGGTELTVGFEGGMLMPGSAFADAEGVLMNRVFGGRGLVHYRF